MLRHGRGGRGAHELEGGEAGLAECLRGLQQSHGGVGAFQAHEGGLRVGGLWPQGQACGRDDAQGAFRTNEEVAQVVAGVVLAQAAQAIPDLALRGHHLQA